MCRIGDLLRIFVIPMAIAGHCSNSPVAPSFQAGARSAASGVEDDSTAALSPESCELDRPESATQTHRHRRCWRSLDRWLGFRHDKLDGLTFFPLSDGRVF